jgi:cytochrome c2
MRKTGLKRTSTAVGITLVCAAVLLALVRSFVTHPDDSHAPGGSEVFEKKGCVQCHFTDSRETKIGPGLKGLFGRDKLPVSDREVTEENVKRQLKTPYDDMPSFADRLTEEQRYRLVAYLKTL